MIINILFRIVALTSKYICTRRQKRWLRFRNIMKVNKNRTDIAEAERAYRHAQTYAYFTHTYSGEEYSQHRL
jgi:hypothetical protein